MSRSGCCIMISRMIKVVACLIQSQSHFMGLYITLYISQKVIIMSSLYHFQKIFCGFSIWGVGLINWLFGRYMFLTIDNFSSSITFPAGVTPPVPGLSTVESRHLRVQPADGRVQGQQRHRLSRGMYICLRSIVHFYFILLDLDIQYSCVHEKQHMCMADLVLFFGCNEFI